MSYNDEEIISFIDSFNDKKEITSKIFDDDSYIDYLTEKYKFVQKYDKNEPYEKYKTVKDDNGIEHVYTSCIISIKTKKKMI